MAGQSLKSKLRGLLRELGGGDPIECEEQIVTAAAETLDRRASEEDMIDAILSCMETQSMTHHPRQIVVRNPDDFDQILDAIASSYGGVPIRFAGTRSDIDSGRDRDEYDEHGRNYRGEDRQPDGGNVKVEVLDGVHDDIPYHRDATEVPGMPRTRHESLHRPAQ